MARMVIRNALFLGRDKVSSLLVPWATYTEPEVAHVGLYERDRISEISVAAMRAGMGLGALASVIHPYPTTAEAIRQTGDAYKRTRLTPVVKPLFHRWLSLGQ